MRKADKWNLLLVNYENPMPKGYIYNLVSLKNGECVDKRVYKHLINMIKHAEKDNVFMSVTWGYRSETVQTYLFKLDLLEKEGNGLTPEEAMTETKKYVASPTESEHHSGLAVDIDPIEGRSTLDEVYDWLSENAYKFGFVLRYPEDKTDITKICFEPWHYRFVGKKEAKEMHQRKICLEEYLAE